MSKNPRWFLTTFCSLFTSSRITPSWHSSIQCWWNTHLCIGMYRPFSNKVAKFPKGTSTLPVKIWPIWIVHLFASKMLPFDQLPRTLIKFFYLISLDMYVFTYLISVCASNATIIINKTAFDKFFKFSLRKHT